MHRRRPTQFGFTCLAALFAVFVSTPTPSGAQVLCDVDGDGRIGVGDGVQTLRAAADLTSTCTLATCDADQNGRITVGDGVNVLRSAADLPGTCDAVGPTPTPERTPAGPATGAIDACDDDCRVALEACGEAMFFQEFESVDECRERCVENVRDFAVEADDFERCVDAQARGIECCTAQGQCGDYPHECQEAFNEAGNACGPRIAGCPLVFAFF